MPKHVYDLAEGNRHMVDLLGGKGANLAEMTALGLPVPPGFTITTQACHAYLTTGVPPAGLATEVSEHLHRLERTTGRKLGQVDQPLLVAVHPGPILDIGLTDDSVAGLAAWTGDERLAWDRYQRLVRVFGTTVLGIDAAHFTGDDGLSTADLRARTARFKDIVRERTGREFPQDPREQLDLAITSVFESWHTGPIREVRGTAVTVCAMVSGADTGTAFTRDPVTGDPVRHPGKLADIVRTLEDHYRDVCEIDFIVERGTLWLLRARPARRSAAAAFLIADRLREEGLIDADEALRRVTGEQLARLGAPVTDLRRAVDRILAHADRRARLVVRANADTPEDAGRARALGADGIGLCRTERMFTGERRALAEQLFRTEDDTTRATAVAAMLPLQRHDFTRILAAVADRPITIRLHGENGPSVYDLQCRAIAEATAMRVRAGGRPQVRIAIPGVADADELELIVTRARRVIAEVALEYGTAIPYELGAMIDVPRAALTAGQLAETACYFAFNTDSLTRTTWGTAHHDGEPLDQDGVGHLIAHAIVEGRAARPDLTLDACGAHAGDPASIRYFHDLRVDNVSCAPDQVPVARLEAGRAAVGAPG